jgi:membrane fusion protein (multidrug efflux system)
MKFVPLRLSLAAVLLGFSACRPAANAPATGGPSARAPQRVEFVELVREDLSETLEVVGTLEANESISIQPELAGIVREIAFEEGQRVKKGALLARLDDAELRAQVAEAEARTELTRIQRERAEALGRDRSIAQAELDQARLEERASIAALELLRVRLERTRIVAPTDGVLGARRLSVGDYATPTSTLTTLDDLSALKVGFRVPERSAPMVRPGTRVTLRVRLGTETEPVRAEGEVFFVSPGIDPALRASEAKAILREVPPGLKPGMFAGVRILLSTREGVLVAPEAALLAGAAGVQLIAVDDKEGKASARYVRVETGLRVGARVEVRPVEAGALEEGQRIVASGVGALVLFPGAPLDPVPAFVEMRPLGSDAR